MSVSFSLSERLKNGYIINGVSHIYSTTKPTARPDASSLVVGDLWCNSISGVRATWNGTYWLNTVVLDAGGYVNYNNSGAGTRQQVLTMMARNFFIKQIFFRLNRLTGDIWDSLNYHTFDISVGSTNVTTALVPLLTYSATVDSVGGFVVDLNSGLLLNEEFYTSRELRLVSTVTSTGNPGTISGGISFNYQEIL
jgi:hypothetical protein